ncbi:hypothetical protein [uncultured Psychroserpens sp.]|uniref:hypothetical protein n=1 Tax=uncultured Psychroserpens sp. TaxID=255436 RepID=UPI0026149173|nr:hypothetical protein [uncultured Psychroserpens sp.]
MTTFEDLKSQWEEQPQDSIPDNGFEIIAKKVNTLKTKQRIANIVLILTVIILIGFFIYVKAHNELLVTFALLLMIGSLLTRVLFEYLSIKKLKQIDVTKNTSSFVESMKVYYKSRIRTHYILTPIIIICYSLGFILLLPYFKKYLSEGFYNYIVFSSIVILLILIVFIRKQILAELAILKGIRFKV